MIPVGLVTYCHGFKKIFLVVLEQILRNLEWKDYGLNMNRVKQNNLRFADDLIIISGD